MSVLTSTFKDVFLGGAEKKAAAAQQRGIEAGQEFIQEGTQQARNDIQGIFPSAQQALQGGFQGAADIFSQAAPQQADVFQAGNVAAQQQIAQGLPQFQNAILGQPVDFSQFQPVQLEQPDFSFLNTQMPQPMSPFAQDVGVMGPAQIAPNGFAPQRPQSFGGGGFNNNLPFLER